VSLLCPWLCCRKLRRRLSTKEWLWNVKPRRNNVLNELIKNFQVALREYNSAQLNKRLAESILEVKSQKHDEAGRALQEHLCSLVGSDVLIVRNKP
jgi:hypothetical protein